MFERKHDVSGPQKSTEALTAAEDIRQLPRLKLVDGNILKLVSRYINYYHTGIELPRRDHRSRCMQNMVPYDDHHYTVPCSACSECDDHEGVTLSVSSLSE